MNLVDFKKCQLSFSKWDIHAHVSMETPHSYCDCSYLNNLNMHMNHVNIG